MSDVVLGIKIKSDGSAQVVGDINRLNTALGQTGAQSRKSVGDVTSLTKALDSAKMTAIGFFSLSMGAGLAKGILDTNRSMEMLRAQLTAVTGSVQGSQAAFKFIQDFAVNTPFEIDGLTKAFLMLQNFGIKPTAAVMNSITNQAAKLGGSQETLSGITLALGQAYSKGKLQAEEMNQLVERGVPIHKIAAQAMGVSVEKIAEMGEKGQITRDAIERIIEVMGEMAQGGNAAAMDTLNGKISNLSDSWSRFEDTLLNSKGESTIRNLITSVTDLINVVERDLSDTVDSQIAKAEARIKTFKSLGAFGQAMADYTGYDIGVEYNKAAALKKQKDAQDLQKKLNSIAEEGLTAINKISEKNDAEDEKRHQKNIKRTSARASSAESAAKQAAKAYQNEREAVEKVIHGIEAETQLIGLSNTERERSIQLRNASAKATEEEAKRIQAALAAQWAKKDADSVAQSAQDAQIQAINEEVDRYNELTMTVRQLREEKLKQQGLSPDQIAPVMQRFDQNSQIEKDNKRYDDAREKMQSYAESVDTAKESTSQLSDITKGLFDTSLSGVSQLAGAFSGMVDSITANTKALDELNKKQREIDAFTPDPGKDSYNEDVLNKQKAQAKNAEELAAVQSKADKDKIASARQVAGSIAQMLKKGTTERKAAHAIEMALAGIEIAMQFKKMLGIGAVTAAETGSVGASVAASTAKGTAKAAEAVATQASAGPYIGFALMAAMAVAMAALGFKTGGAANAKPAASLPRAPETGTVLGDSAAQSESIDNVATLLDDIHAKEYRELKGINQGVWSLKDGIADSLANWFKSKNMLPPTGLKLGTTLNQPKGFTMIDPVSKFIVKGIFGTTTRKVTGNGINVDPMALSEILAGAQISAQQWTEITTTKKSWFSKKTSVDEILSPLDQNLKDSLTQIFKGMGESVLGMADDFGLDMTQNLKEYKIPQLRIDLSKMTGEQAAKKLNAVLSTQLDRMTGKVFGDLVKQYQKLGEGAFQTASRLKIQNEVIDDALKSSSQTFDGDLTRIADGISTLFGSVKDFKSAFQDYFSAFYTEQEQIADAKRRLDAVFEDNGKLPASRDAYRDLVKAQDLTTLAGRQLYFQLIDLADAADEYYSAQEDLAKSAENELRNLAGLAPTVRSEIYNMNQSLIEARANWRAAGLDLQEMGRLTELAFADLKNKILSPFTSARDDIATQLAQANGTALPVGDVAAMTEALKTMTDPTQQINQISKIQKAIKTRYDNEVALINKTQKAFNGIREFLDSLKLSELSTFSPEAKLLEARSQYIATLLKAQTSDQDAINKLPEVSRNYLNEAKGYYASGADYAAIFEDVNTDLKTIVGDTKTTVLSLNDALGVINTATSSISGSIATLNQAFSGISAEMLASSEYTQQAQAVVNTAKESMSNSLSSLSGVYKDLLTGTTDSATATAAAQKVVSDSRNTLAGAVQGIDSIFSAMGQDATLSKEATSAAKLVVESARTALTTSLTDMSGALTSINSVIASSSTATETASAALESAMDAANDGLTTSLQTLDSIIASFVETLGAQFDSILDGTVTPDPEPPTTQEPDPNQKSTYNTLVEKRDATQKIVDEGIGAKEGKKLLKPKKQAAKVAANQLKNYMFWHELGEEEKAIKSIKDTEKYYQVLENTKDKSLTKDDRRFYKEMLPTLTEEKGGTVKFRASGGMTSGRTVIHENGPELVDFAHPTMVTSNKNTQAIIALGNKQANAELEKQTKELQAMVRILQASNSAIIERLDKGNESAQTAARAAKLKAMASA